jgi:5-methylcytosine-specific restriction enzyme subunit McrC
LKALNKISVFEHERLVVDQQGFTQGHLDALLKLNDLHEGKYFQPIARGIKFNQYVGVIQVDGLSIEINPKADKDDDRNRWKGVLLGMLKACGHLKASSTGPARVKRQHLNLLEVYFELYLLELEGLIRKGLIKQYRKRTHNVKALKGKLEFAGNIQRNLIHKERFYTTHQVYDTEHVIHEVLLAALQIVDQFTRGTRLYDQCKRIELVFPELTPRKITAELLDKIHLTRKSRGYSYALELARLIILHYSPDIISGKKKMLSLLFDMNTLWEEYVFKMLKKACQGTDIEVTAQDQKPFWDYNSLRPDIVLRKGNKTYVIDTKWKRPQNNAASIHDLRQMYAYGRFWDAEKALLLYPGDYHSPEFKAFKTRDFSLLEGEFIPMDHHCKMGYVSVLDPRKEVGLDDQIGNKVLSLLEIDKKYAASQ